MPIYEYRCRDCGRSFEVLVPSARHGAEKCILCGGAAIDRQPSRFSLAGPSSEPAVGGASGGCCGGGCGCSNRAG